MAEPEDRIDRETARNVRRIHDQLYADGKLDKAIATEGAGILFAPLCLGAVGLVGWALKSLGTDGTGTVLLGVPILIGLLFLAVYLMHRG